MREMKLVGIFLFTVVFLSSCGDSIKVAYANNNQLFNGFELKIELTKKLEVKKVASQLTLDSIKFELVELKKKIEITEVPNEGLIKNHQLLYNEYLTKEKSFIRSNEQLAQQYDEQIMKQLNEYIKNYAKEQHINVLLGVGDGNLLYAEDNMDITDDLIKYSNLKYNGK
jgi:outer membrane protein